jgi:hypothetical protein
MTGFGRELGNYAINHGPTDLIPHRGKRQIVGDVVGHVDHLRCHFFIEHQRIFFEFLVRHLRTKVFRQVLRQQRFLRLVDGGSAEGQRVMIVRRTGFGHLFDAANECFFRVVHGPEVVAVTADAVFPQQIPRRASRIQFFERIEVQRFCGSPRTGLRALIAPGEDVFLLRRSPLHCQIAFLTLSRSQLH